MAAGQKRHHCGHRFWGETELTSLSVGVLLVVAFRGALSGRSSSDGLSIGMDEIEGENKSDEIRHIGHALSIRVVSRTHVTTCQHHGDAIRAPQVRMKRQGTRENTVKRTAAGLASSML